MSESSGNGLAGYRFHRVLGEGDGTRAFEATETASGETVVIESLVGEDARDPELREWFTWAWEALAELDHANLPEVRDVGEGGEGPFAVRQPAEGAALPQLIEEGERIDPAQVRMLICRMADGLHAAHEAGVIHGSLGPGELIVGPGARGAPSGTWVGFGRAEGLRADDLRDLGNVLSALLAAERDTRAGEELDEEDEEGPSMDEAILAMLARVAARARDGGYRTAAEFRDEVAAGTEQPRGWRRVRSFFRPADGA